MIDVIDNYLSTEDFLEIKKSLYDDTFPWYFRKNKVVNGTYLNNEDIDKSDNFNFQFVHYFYKFHCCTSTYSNSIQPLIKKINPATVLKIKANLVPRTENIIPFKLHIDQQKFNGKTAIYFLNTNNGYTFFNNGTKIDSIENRLIIFNSLMPHSGTTCTDKKTRCLINLNYTEFIT